MRRTAAVRLKPDATKTLVRLKPDATKTLVRLKPDATKTVLALVLLLLGTHAHAQSTAPAFTEQRVPWAWGDLVYGREYTGVLTIRNTCAVDATVTLIGQRLPGLSIDALIRVPAKSSMPVPYKIHQAVPAAATGKQAVNGQLMVWTPPQQAQGCPASVTIHQASGTFRTATPDEERQAQQEAMRQRVEAACTAWWFLGSNPMAGNTTAQPPAVAVDDAACAAQVRPLARWYLETVLGPRVQRSPQAWSWLGSMDINRLSMADLVAFRMKAVQTMAQTK